MDPEHRVAREVFFLTSVSIRAPGGHPLPPGMPDECFDFPDNISVMILLSAYTALDSKFFYLPTLPNA
jgi:hypothetical protein